MCTHDNFIVLPSWETRHLGPGPDIPLVTLSWHWANESLLYPNNAERMTKKGQAYIFTSLVLVDQGSNPWVRSPQSTKNGRKTLNSFGHCCHIRVYVLPPGSVARNHKRTHRTCTTLTSTINKSLQPVWAYICYNPVWLAITEIYFIQYGNVVSKRSLPYLIWY